PGADISPNLVADIVQGALQISGQACFAIKRVYVPESVLSPFLTRIEGVLREYVVGDGLDPATTLGPLHNRTQHERALSLLDSSTSEGGDAVAFGTLQAGLEKEGYFMRPHVV